MYKDFGIIIYPDENLAKIIGSEPMKNTEMIKRIWKYIKENDLMKKE